jgi:hypothetical protein
MQHSDHNPHNTPSANNNTPRRAFGQLQNSLLPLSLLDSHALLLLPLLHLPSCTLLLVIVGYYKGLTATKTFYRIWNFLELFLSTLHQIFLQEFKGLKEGHALAIGHDHDESSRTLSTQNSPETQSAGRKSCNVEKEHMLYAKLLLLCNQQITLQKQQQQQQTSHSYVLPL